MARASLSVQPTAASPCSTFLFPPTTLALSPRRRLLPRSSDADDGQVSQASTEASNHGKYVPPAAAKTTPLPSRNKAIFPLTPMLVQLAHARDRPSQGCVFFLATTLMPPRLPQGAPTALVVPEWWRPGLGVVCRRRSEIFTKIRSLSTRYLTPIISTPVSSPWVSTRLTL